MNDSVIISAVAHLTEPSAEQTERAIAKTRETLLAEITQMEVDKMIETPVPAAPRRTPFRLLRRTVGVAACAILAVGISWNYIDSSRSFAFTQMIDAIQNAATAHYVVQDNVDGEWIDTLEVWHSRSQGVYERRRDREGVQVRIDDGSRLWVYREGADQATVAQSVGVTGMLEQIVKPLSLEVKFIRDPSKDRTVEGTHCRYHYSVVDTGELVELWVDKQERCRLALVSIKAHGNWEERRRSSVSYDLPVDANRFRPSFTSDVRIADLSESFGKLFPLDDSIYRTTKHGFEVGVHELRSVSPNAFLAVVSIRPTQETRQRSPREFPGQKYGQFIAVETSDLHEDGIFQKAMSMSHFEADGVCVQAYLFTHTSPGKPLSPTAAVFTIGINDYTEIMKLLPVRFNIPLPSTEQQTCYAMSAELEKAIEELYTKAIAVEQLPVDTVTLSLAPRAMNERELREMAARTLRSVEELRGSTLVPKVRPSETSLEQFLDTVERRLESKSPRDGYLMRLR